ncbi:MAG TPA: ankyrin repeat domain-containing protein [Steroidobacteraceae bacterium]|nr:ankyrin repeat domain-containing protein [Steroidobacteraceae bacterium]
MRLRGGTALLIGVVTSACVGLLVWVQLSSQARSEATELRAAAGAQLVEAVRLGDAAKARALIQRGADVNAASPDGTSALHWAVHRDDVATATLLIRHRARIDVVNRYALAPLHVAAAEGHPRLVQLLLDAGASVNLRGRNAETPLLMAARKGCAECVQALIAKGADVNVRDEAFALTPLMLASWSGSAQSVEHLLRAGADVDAQTRLGPMPKFIEPNAGRASHGDGILRGGVPERGSRPARAGGMTALHYAAREGHTAVAQLLVAHGARIEQPEANDVRPLLLAIINDRVATARYLIEQGADVNAGDWYGRTPLWAAVDARNVELDGELNTQFADRAGELEIIRLLLARGADPNARTRESPPPRMWLMQAGSLSWVDFTGQTPFLRAALAGDVTVMRLLLEYKADPNIPTFGGTTPLMAAAGVNWVYFQTFDEGQEQLLEAVKLCVSLGQDVNAANSMGIRAIHGAANRGSDAILKYLVEQGARLDAKDNQGRSPYTWAQGVFLATHAAVPKPSTMRLIEELCRSTGQRCPAAVPAATVARAR